MNQFKSLSIALSLILALSIFVSCSKDDDAPNIVTLPASTLGTYTGTLSYSSSAGDNIANTSDGTATISFDSNIYTISFSDNVPSMTGLKFVGTDGTYVTTSESDATGIGIDGDELSIGSSSDGNAWSFSDTK